MEKDKHYIIYIKGKDGNFLGSLEEVKGKLSFKGNATKAAKEFFDVVIRLYDARKKVKRPEEVRKMPNGFKSVNKY